MVWPCLNSDKLDVMFAAFQEELWETASIEDFTFTILLNNDTRDQVLASFQGVYVNGLPIAYEESFEMARRDTLEIRLGDVAGMRPTWMDWWFWGCGVNCCRVFWHRGIRSRCLLIDPGQGSGGKCA